MKKDAGALKKCAHHREFPFAGILNALIFNCSQLLKKGALVYKLPRVWNIPVIVRLQGYDMRGQQ